MGRASRMRSYRRSLRAQPPMRTVPSRRGLVATFLIWAAVGAASGFVVNHFFVPRGAQCQ